MNGSPWIVQLCLYVKSYVIKLFDNGQNIFTNNMKLIDYHLNAVDEGDDEIAVPNGSEIGYKRIGTAIGKLFQYVIIFALIDKRTQSDVTICKWGRARIIL